MKKLSKIIVGITASLCLWIIPTAQPAEASQTPLTVNIPDGVQVQVSNKTIKINSEDDGTVTFEGKTEANAEITIAKRGGNNRHYKVEADENGNFSKTLNLSSKTKKCKFIITSEDDNDSKSAKTTFSVTNKAYVKSVVDSDSSSSSSSSIDEESSTESSLSTNTSATGDMKTDQANGMIVGNANFKIYHTPDQQGYHMNSANAVYFNTEAEAQAAGYRKSLR
ncbi:Ig-like domain-containing protein [Limosilactobacillus reuteri]|uniref:sunset domain-containing protein n=1 Tax=Limosilactobacillus reuteri TaxID=1598 RepID=UPI000A1E4AFB|nr:Ig-like domain-containing protein [Limosilactobacillus reuteri]MCH9393868.1 Ig-like domain-containing protein [Limosilactobacillus reuteri]